MDSIYPFEAPMLALWAASATAFGLQVVLSLKKRSRPVTLIAASTLIGIAGLGFGVFGTPPHVDLAYHVSASYIEASVVDPVLLLRTLALLACSPIGIAFFGGLLVAAVALGFTLLRQPDISKEVPHRA